MTSKILQFTVTLKFDRTRPHGKRTKLNPPIGIPNNLPRSGVAKFVGRDDALLSLHQKLQEKERVAICAIAGMGGIGKTELALQYSLYHQQTYTGGICWLQAGGVDVGIEIVRFAKTQLGLQPPDDWELQDQVSYCWRRWREGEVLVVLDDVRDYQEVESYLPPAELRFKVLITTRRQWLDESLEQLNLEVLSEDDSLELLVSFVGDKRIQREFNQAQQLCRDLGYLPLGIGVSWALFETETRFVSGSNAAKIGIVTSLVATRLSWYDSNQGSSGCF